MRVYKQDARRQPRTRPRTTQQLLGLIENLPVGSFDYSAMVIDYALSPTTPRTRPSRQASR